MTVRPVKRLAGMAAGIILAIFGKKNTKPTGEELAKADYKISTGRMGVSFTEKLRKVLRFKWLKKI
jgi:hypothetical protein